MLTMGVDLGQSVDPTAVVVIETDRARVHAVRWIESLPVGMSYPEQLERLVVVNERARADGPTITVVDYTGVGRPVVDLLRRRLHGGVKAVTISGANAVTQPNPYEVVVPKRDLIGALEVVLQTHRLVIVDGLQGTSDLRAELVAFQFELSQRGRDTYEAASGFHDDLVLALSLAIWNAEKDQGWVWREYWRRDLEPIVGEEQLTTPSQRAIAEAQRALERHTGRLAKRRPRCEHLYSPETRRCYRCGEPAPERVA
ncbi:MAG: hypothetical protein ABSA08_00770 [Acidimicrobiales bacterium]|jgi:hypothetical protein